MERKIIFALLVFCIFVSWNRGCLSPQVEERSGGLPRDT